MPISSTIEEVALENVVKSAEREDGAIAALM